MGSGASAMNQEGDGYKHDDKAPPVSKRNREPGSEFSLVDKNHNEGYDGVNFEQVLVEDHSASGINSPRTGSNDVYNQGAIVADSTTIANPIVGAFTTAQLKRRDRSNSLEVNDGVPLPPIATPNSANDPHRKKLPPRAIANSAVSGWVENVSGSSSHRKSDPLVSHVKRYCSESIKPFSKSVSDKSL